MDETNNDPEHLLRTSALRTSNTILLARQRAEQELLQAKKALELKTEQLAHSLSMMRATLESTSDGILVTDDSGNVTDFNENYVAMWQMSRHVLDLKDSGRVREAAAKQFRDPQQFLARIQEIEASSLPESFDVLEFVDGRVFERYSKIQCIEERNVGRVWTFRDVTEHKRAEEKLRAAKVAAEEGSKAKDDFLAVLSHELRTPLTPALAAASYLAEHEELPPQLREEVNAIRRNVQLEARLIDDLLDLTRISRGKIELHLEAVDVHKLLRNTLEIVHEDIVFKELKVLTDFRAHESYVRADSVRIQQVFWNLLNNAVKFTPHGGRVTIRSWNGDQRQCFVEVSDTGIGIEPEQQSRIFNAFEQAERSITRQFGGLGLGLAISKTLVDLHGGSISVTSEGKNRGASFTVALAAHATPEVTPKISVPGNGSLPASLQVLIVDDHAETLRVLSALLRKRGHVVSTADSSQGALTILDNVKFDVLISDIGLPDGNGYDLIREAKKRQSLKGVALSGFGMEEDMRVGKEAGFDYHLTKPIEFQKLEGVLREIGS
ncbi:MAG TPA: ATP-binding protein [Chthoniobacterales bacterium]